MQGGVVQALSSSADVEGLYESNVPLEMEAEIQLGCTTALQKDAKQISLASGFALNELNMKPSSSPTYLTSTENEKPILWHVGKHIVSFLIDSRHQIHGTHLRVMVSCCVGGGCRSFPCYCPGWQARNLCYLYAWPWCSGNNIAM